jgi:predicted tellurium resistance membrane protein TerC
MSKRPLPLPDGLGKAVKMASLSLPAAPTALSALAAIGPAGIALGIDTLIFIAILSSKLPVYRQAPARRSGARPKSAA